MNLIEFPLGAAAWILSEATMERLGWVLMHSLWQFLLTAILAMTVLFFAKRSSASLRYVLLVFTMAVSVVSPVATWFMQPTDAVFVAPEVRRDAAAPLQMESMPSQLGARDEVVIVSDGHGAAEELPTIGKPPSVKSSQSVAESSDWWMNARDRFRPWLMSIVTVWILGVMICATRPLLGWIAIRRWRRVGTTPVSQEVTELLLQLSDRLAVRRTVEILQSSLVHVPLVFGCLRPLILLPASLLTNLPTSQLEAIIAHELAHVRRHDFLVNFMQTIIETLFFYHPAIWWLSHRIRIERENCCDDLVVSVLCNRVEYGKALLAVEESPGLARALALGARDGSLLARVQRLAGLEATRRRPVASVAAMITSGLLIAGTAFMIGSLLFAAGDDNEALFGNPSNGLQIRLVPLTPDVSDDSPELQKIASSFKRSQEMTFAVQLKNVSSQPISLAGIRYGEVYAPETRGKLNTAMLAPHWFEFEFTGMDGKRILRTPHREFYQGWFVADNSSVHVLAPGESLIEVLRPAKFMQPMDYDLLPGKYRVQVHYRGPNDSLRDNVRKHWPDKPILNAWPHQATSNVSEFSIEEASYRTKPEELIWGKPVKGLQAALEYRLPDDAKGNPLIAPGVSVGSHLGITFHLRNVSDKPITFVSETGRQGDKVHVTDESGKAVEVQDAFFTGEPIDVEWKLMPGEVAQLSLLTPGLRSLGQPGMYKVLYTIRFNSRIQKDEAGNVIFPRPGDYDEEVDTGETPLFLHEPKNDLSANGEIQPDGQILDGSFRDEVNLKLTRADAHQGKWYFIDLDHGKLKTPPFDVEIDATRFPYFVTKPSEEELSDWLKRDGVDLILRSSIYRPDPKGPIEKNDIQVRSVRTLLKELPRGLEKETTNSPTWKQTLEEDVLDAFGAKDDAVHVVGFIPNATAVDIRPVSPFLRSFRTASNLLGVFLLEQPSSIDDELNLRIGYAANKDTPLDDLRFGPDDFVSGLELLEQPTVRKSSEAPFIAKFPNDIRVEFVGLSRGVGDFKAADKWWRPDGSPLEQAPEHRGASGVLKEGELESEDPFVRTVIHVHGIGDSNAVTATASIQTAESLKDKSGGLYVAHHGYADAPGRSRTFEVGVATEAPSPKRWLDRAGKRIESKTESVKDPVVEDITIEKVGPESWGKGSTSKGGMTDPVGPGDKKMGNLSGTTQVTVRFPLTWRSVDLRLFAVDKSGKSHGVDMTITLDPNDENADYKRLAIVFPVDYSDVDHFEYQFRVYRHWATFENVSLSKETQTGVVMKSETIATTPSAKSISGNNAEHSAVGVLPNGDTVELVHLARGARWGITGKRVWWKPDGTLDEETNATEVEPEMIRRIANDRRLFAIHMSSTNPQPSIHLKTIPPKRMEASAYVDFTDENGKPARSLSGQFGPASDEKYITLEVGVTSEPWGAWQDVGLAGEALSPFDDKQNYADFYRMIKVVSAGQLLVTMLPPPEKVPLLSEKSVSNEKPDANWVSTVATLQWPENHDDLFAFEFRAVGTDGATSYANGSTGTDNSGKTQFWFNGDVLREKLTKYQCRLRPYRYWVTFEDVANQAHVQTNPKVKVEAAPAVNSMVVSNETQPAKVTIASESASKAEAVIKPHRVVDAQGKPVAGAKIDCLPSMKYSWLEAPKSLGSTVTDSGGWFDYPDGLPSKERFYVYVSSDGFLERVFQANNGEAYVLEKEIRKPDTLALRRPITVSGRIVGIDGKPLADAEIAVDYMFEGGVAQINSNRVKSDAEGRFVAKGVEPANVFVRYETPYKTNEERMPIGIQPGKLCIVAFTATDGQLKDDIVLDLSKCNCIVEGRIVDHEDKGVPNRWIQATIASAKGRLDESITVKSDAEGRFRFEGLTADEFTIGTYTPSLRETVKLSLEKPAKVLLTTYVRGKTPPANEPNPPIYGEPSESGIVGGIRIQGGVQHKLGDVITAEVLIKNKSDQVKMFAYSFAEQANLRASEGDKAVAELNYRHFTGVTVTTHYRLEPNQEAVVGSFNFGLHDPDDKQNGLPKATFQIPCRAGRALTLRCDMSANLFGRTREDNAATPKDGPLSTGALSITVMPTSALSQVVRDADRILVAANRGSLKGRFVFEGIAPTPIDYFGNREAVDWSKLQQPGPDGRKSGVEALYRVFLAEGIQPETKTQTLLVGNDSGVANIYIWATSKNIPWDAPAGGLAPVNVEFRDGKLTNRCIKVVPNQKLQFENRDPVDHSFAANFMKARNTSFNLFVKAKSKVEGDWSFPVAEPFPTRLDLGRAPWASGVLFVHGNPYVAITRSDGSFEIENLPIGEWEFQVWHESGGYLLPNKGVFKYTIVDGENNLGTKLLKPEAFGIHESTKAVPVKPENREQIGTVQGKPVYRDEIANGNLLELFTQPIWTKYKQEHREAIEPTEKELESARGYFSQQHRSRLEKEGGESKLREELKAIEDKLSNSKLSEEEANKLELEHFGLRARLRPFDPGFANFILDNWKLQKHLYENFGGGRVLWQQAGQEAFDAMRTWLELQEKNGEFQITDTKLRTQFYQYWNQDHGAFLTSDEKRIREEFLQPPWIARVVATDDVSQKVLSPTNAKNDIEKNVLDILRKPFIDDPDKGTWQLGAHDIDVHWKLRDLPQRIDVIKTLFKVVDRTVPSSMHERWLAMGFLGGADPKNLVPRLNKEIEIAIANPAKPFAAYHEIEMLGRLGENARSSLPLLIKLLDSTDGVAYNLALDSLTKIGARSPDVMNELAKHTDDPVTVYQLGRYGQMAKAHGPLFVKLLDSPSNEIHTWAAKALVKTGFDETRGYDLLIADVAAGKSENRCRAATALAALGSQAKEMIPRLRPYENDPDPQVAKAVRDAIVRIEKDDRIFTHAEEATKRETALEASAALNPQIHFNLRIVGGEERTPIAGIEIVATNGYGDSQKKFGPFLTDASGETLCKLPQGFYTLHLNSKNELPYLPYEKFWKELPPPGFKWLDLRVTGIGVEKWLGGEISEKGVEHAKSSQELTRITFTLLKPIELVLRAVDKKTGRGLPGGYFYLESAGAEDWAHPIDGANLGATHYREGEHAFDSGKYQTDADGYFKRFISDGYLRRSGDSEWGPKFGVWKAPEGYEVVEPQGEVAIDFPADNRSSVEKVFYFRQLK